jgi:predicted nucleic acid-binding protein
MPERRLYDTRFFVEYFYSDNAGLLDKLKEELRLTKENLVSAVTVHEMHRINLVREGKAVASLRSSTMRADFKIIDVDYLIAVKSAELRNSQKMPMVDSVIAATAQIYDCSLFTDDAHFKGVPNLKTKWCSSS